MFLPLFGLILAIVAVCFWHGRSRAVAVSGANYSALHSLPGYHGWWLALMTAGPAFAVLVLWSIISPYVLRPLMLSQFAPQVAEFSAAQLDGFWRDIQAIAGGGTPGVRDAFREEAAAAYRSVNRMSLVGMIALMTLVGAGGFYVARNAIAVNFRARHRVETAVKVFLAASATVAILTTVGIVLSLLFESLRFFSLVNPMDFLFGTTWTPQQMAFRTDQVGGTAAFGFIPLLTGTLLITFIAMVVAAPDRKSVV